MKKQRDYTWAAFLLTFGVITVMVLLSFIPPADVGPFHLRRANILSELIEFDDPERVTADGGLRPEDMEFVNRPLFTQEAPEESAVQMPEVPAEVEPVGASSHVFDTGISHAHGDVGWEGTLERTFEGDYVPFEDFSGPDGRSIADFVAVLDAESQRRVVRIAFFGDSFIEGDIITGDVRTILQSIYGGEGIGFLPLATPVETARNTIRHNFSGWETYSLVNRRSAPSGNRDKFSFSGIQSVSTAGSVTSVVSSMRPWSRTRLLYRDSGGTTVSVAVNDSLKKDIRVEGGEGLRQTVIEAPGTMKVRLNVRSAGFTGYGVSLEGAAGVVVDNFSLRSNSGLALLGSDPETNRQMSRILDYDLIVLQYGLNTIETNRTDYSAYGEQFSRVIAYVRTIYPEAVIVVMGVGDRSTQRSGSFVTMPAIRAMIEQQRQCAEQSGVVFWNTFEAMGGVNSMPEFVRKGWAARDYTHLSHRGGKYIAEQFVNSLIALTPQVPVEPPRPYRVRMDDFVPVPMGGEDTSAGTIHPGQALGQHPGQSPDAPTDGEPLTDHPEEFFTDTEEFYDNRQDSAPEADTDTTPDHSDTAPPATDDPEEYINDPYESGGHQEYESTDTDSIPQYYQSALSATEDNKEGITDLSEPRTKGESEPTRTIPQYYQSALSATDYNKEVITDFHESRTKGQSEPTKTRNISEYYLYTLRASDDPKKYITDTYEFGGHKENGTTETIPDYYYTIVPATREGSGSLIERTDEQG